MLDKITVCLLKFVLNIFLNYEKWCFIYFLENNINIILQWSLLSLLKETNFGWEKGNKLGESNQSVWKENLSDLIDLSNNKGVNEFYNRRQSKFSNKYIFCLKLR